MSDDYISKRLYSIPEAARYLGWTVCAVREMLWAGSGVRNMTRSGILESVAMRISGHKTRSVFDRYNITSEEDLKTAAGKVMQYQDMMREMLERKQREVTGTGIGTGNAFEGENPSFSDLKDIEII